LDQGRSRDLHITKGLGEGEQEVGDRQQQGLLQLKPRLRLFMEAFRAMAIAAGVITVARFFASCTAIDLTTQGCGAAALNRVHGLAVRGQQLGGILLAIGRTIAAKDICQF